ncbi:hypothetical protein UMZ34_02205 [Halopseudomonas pachastrellae]|nr:hypothetical protein UMZ34_02205 [Halopseudomonas pachastrellae]
MQYVRLTDELQGDLLRISLARGKLFSQNDPTLLANLQRLVKAAQERASALDALPLLGVVEEKDSSNDPFASLLGVTTSNSNEATDPGADYKRTLLSLLNRYPGELERTSALIVERAQLQSITGERIDSLQAGAAQMRPALTAARDGITVRCATSSWPLSASLLLSPC